MLNKLRLINFKSFADQTLPFAPVTYLVGANASGKTNVFDALRVLRMLGLGLSLYEAIEGDQSSGPEFWSGIRGKEQEVYRIGTSQLTIESEWTVNHVQVRHRIETEGPKTPIQLEKFWHINPDKEVELIPRHPSLGSSRLDASIASKNIQFRYYDPNDPWFQAINRAYEQMRFFEPNLHAMRKLITKKENDLRDDASNIAAVIFEMKPDERQNLVDWISEVCAPKIRDIGFVDVQETNEILLKFIEESGQSITIRSLSEGTLRFLALMVAILSLPEGYVLLLEEPELGLHPTRIRVLHEALEMAAVDRNIQIIATTHSPVVLDWASDEALANTLAFGRNDNNETIVRRLGDLPHFESLRSSREVGHLFTTGWVELEL